MGPEAVGVIAAFIAVLLFAVRASGRAVQTFGGHVSRAGRSAGRPASRRTTTSSGRGRRPRADRAATGPAGRAGLAGARPADACGCPRGRCSGTGIRRAHRPGSRLRGAAAYSLDARDRDRPARPVQPRRRPRLRRRLSRRGSAAGASGRRRSRSPSRSRARTRASRPSCGRTRTASSAAGPTRRPSWSAAADPPGARVALARPRRHRLARGRRPRPGRRRSSARARLPSPRLLLLRLRGGRPRS